MTSNPTRSHSICAPSSPGQRVFLVSASEGHSHRRSTRTRGVRPAVQDLAKVHTTKLRTVKQRKKLPEQRSHVIARAHLELGVSWELARQVIYKGADPTLSPSRRRIYAWAVARGLFVEEKTEPVEKLEADLEALKKKLGTTP